MNLQEQGVLAAIHPAFVLGNQVIRAFQNVRSVQPDGMPIPEARTDLYWHILLCQIKPQTLSLVCDRLLFGRKMSESLLQASELVRDVDKLSQPEMQPSAIVNQLENVTELALLAVWYVSENEQVREKLRRFWVSWRHVQPKANGDTLKQMGLKAGPCYKVILTRAAAGLVGWNGSERNGGKGAS